MYKQGQAGVTKASVSITFNNADRSRSPVGYEQFVEKQADIAKASFDAFVKQSARFNEMYLAAAKDVFAPLSDRASATADMAKNLRA